jgi:hypothetical protein
MEDLGYFIYNLDPLWTHSFNKKLFNNNKKFCYFFRTIYIINVYQHQTQRYMIVSRIY